MKTRWMGGAVIGGMILFAVLIAPQLPEQVPTHWNHRGEVDGWGPWWVALMIPIGAALGIWLLAMVFPRMDPRGENYERFQKTYWLVINSIVLTQAAVLGILIGAALGWSIRIEIAMPVVIGVLFLVIGNLLPRVRSNWILGIRTPWTLENERVWRKTHRLGGWCMVGAGILILFSVILPPDTRVAVLLVASLGGALVPAVASYFFWRHDRREADA